jgi:hypothetical protein
LIDVGVNLPMLLSNQVGWKRFGDGYNDFIILMDVVGIGGEMRQHLMDFRTKLMRR